MATFDVLLPVKNGLAYLAEAMDSIRHQSLRDWRMIVLDHGSSDGSLDLAHRYAESDPRIVVRCFPDAQGLSGLLNRGLELCDSRYVLRQDADDVSMPGRMEVLAGAFEDDDKLVLAGSLGLVIDARGRSIGRIDMPRGPNGVAAAALFRTPVAHPTVAMRLDAIQRIGARYGEDFLGAMPAGKRLRVPGLAEDYFMFGQLAFAGRCMNVERNLVKYRWHGGNVAATRYLEQMRVSLEISRYLAESLSIVHGLDCPDPAPFCNHGEQLFDVDGRQDFVPEWRELRTLLQKTVPACAGLERELAFRKVIANRGRAAMFGRLCAFALRHGTYSTERRTVKLWLTRGLRRRAPLTLTSSGLSA